MDSCIFFKTNRIKKPSFRSDRAICTFLLLRFLLRHLSWTCDPAQWSGPPVLLTQALIPPDCPVGPGAALAAAFLSGCVLTPLPVASLSTLFLTFLSLHILSLCLDCHSRPFGQLLPKLRAVLSPWSFLWR